MNMNLISSPLILLPVRSGKEQEWGEIRENFAGSKLLEMGQSWLPEKEPGLRQGEVRAGICGDALAIYAELSDDDIYNDSVSLNEKTWETGDAFEMFLKSEALPEYYEFHVTPGNQKLQLRIPSEEAFRQRPPWGTHCLEGDLFFSKTKVNEGQWLVYAEIPLHFFPEGPWRFSFCRYDRTRGIKRPVLSSTSPYVRCDFHRVQDWGLMKKA